MHYDPTGWRAAYQVDGFVLVPDLFDPSTKTIHGAGHNLSAQVRRVILTGRAGPDSLPTRPTRGPYEGLRPRSQQPAYKEQLRLTFPHLCHDN